MMGSRRRHQRPIYRLAQAMGSAAANIHDPKFRAIAAREAETIPKEASEIGGGKKGEMARLGRAKLAALVTMQPEDLADAQVALRGFRDALMGRFDVTSEISLSDRRRRRA